MLFPRGSQYDLQIPRNRLVESCALCARFCRLSNLNGLIEVGVKWFVVGCRVGAADYFDQRLTSRRVCSRRVVVLVAVPFSALAPSLIILLESKETTSFYFLLPVA